MDMGLLWAIPCRSMLSVFMSMLFGHSSVHSAFCAASRFVLFCFWFWYWARFRFWFRFWFLFWSFVSSIGRVRALLPSLSLSVECLCLCFDFGLDSILYLIIYCPACAKKKEEKIRGDSQKTKREKDMYIQCGKFKLHLLRSALIWLFSSLIEICCEQSGKFVKKILAFMLLLGLINGCEFELLISPDTAHPQSTEGHFHVAQSQNPISS